MGIITQINISSGGVPKHPVDQAEVAKAGIVGDDHNDKEHHGSLDQALCLYSVEVIEALQREGHPIGPGTTGENITVSGIDWTDFTPGRKVRLGDTVLIELTDFATPCRTISGSFSDGRSARIHHHLHPDQARIYAKVLQEGTIKPGQSIEIA